MFSTHFSGADKTFDEQDETFNIEAVSITMPAMISCDCENTLG